VVLALVLFILSKTIAAFRLQAFLQAVKVYISERYNLKLYLLGMYYNLFLPGGIGGDGYKVYVLNKDHNTGVKPLVKVMILDRLNGVLALFCLGVLFVFFTPLEFPYKFLLPLLLPLALLGFFLLLHWFFRNFTPLFTKVTLYSFGVQLCQVITAIALLYALGEKEHTIAYISLFLASSIMAALPLTIGGAGAREVTFLYGATYLGLQEDVSVAVSLLFYLITAFVSFLGIYYSFHEEALKK
jgi:uncharacterized membrane protein YbhN (UPF0104 family)